MILDRVQRIRRPKFVYFARVGEYLKVGCSINPAQRIKAIRNGSGYRPDDIDMFAPVELLKVIPGGFDHELQFQAALVDFHVTGEWFTATPEVLEWVDQIGSDHRAS